MRKLNFSINQKVRIIKTKAIVTVDRYIEKKHFNEVEYKVICKWEDENIIGGAYNEFFEYELESCE
jgi:hypothetical protein